MRKIVSIALAVSLLATLFAGLSVSAAYDATHVYKMSEANIDDKPQVTPVVSDDGSYVTITSKADANDPYFRIRLNNVPSSEYKVVTIRYAADSLHGNQNFLRADGHEIGSAGTGTANAMTANGQWMWKSYTIGTGTGEAFSGVVDTLLTHFRVVGAKAGDSIRVAYIGFFKTLQEAKDYDYDYVTTNKLGMLGDHTGSTNLFRINSDGLILDGVTQAGSNLSNTNNKIEYTTAYTVKSSIGIFGWISTPDGIEKLQYSINSGEYKDISTSINVRTDLIGQVYDAGRHAGGFNFSINLPEDMEDNSTISLRAISKAGDTIDFCTFADVSLEERKTADPTDTETADPTTTETSDPTTTETADPTTTETADPTNTETAAPTGGAGSGEGDSSGSGSGGSSGSDNAENPGTGDNNAVAMFVLVAMLAAAAVSVAVLLKKRSYEG